MQFSDCLHSALNVIRNMQCANIGGTLVAVLAFIAFINGVLVWCGSLVGIQDLTFEYVLGLFFIPAAWLMGVETKVRFNALMPM